MPIVVTWMVFAVLRLAAFWFMELVEPHKTSPGIDGTYIAAVWTFAAFSALFLSMAATMHSAWLLLLLPLAIPLVLPWPVVRYVLIPRGWVRTSYRLTRLTTTTWQRDRVGGAAFAAAWALCRQPEVRAADRQWIEDQIAAEPALTGAGLGALGLVAASRGDLDEAVAFLDVVALFDRRILDSELIARSADWRIGEAARRGDWPRIEAIGGSHGQLSPQAKLLVGIARRIVGAADAPTEAELEDRWSQLPADVRPDHALLQRWCRSVDASPASASPPRDDASALDVALIRHLEILDDPRPSAARLGVAAQTWEIALDDLARPLSARAAEIGGRRIDPVATIRTEIEEALAAVVEAHHVPLTELGADGLLGEAASRRRDDLLSAIELAADHLQHRVDAQSWRGPVEEARAWTSLIRVYQIGIAAGGDQVRQLMFRVVYGPLCSLSVELYNNQGQRWLSNAITRWLLEEATLAGDARAIELQQRNLSL